MDILIGCVFFTGKMAFDGHDTRQIPALGSIMLFYGFKLFTSIDL